MTKNRAATPKPEGDTRFTDFDDDVHPFRKWWNEHGQYMLSGGGRRESIWAARGWIAREQLGFGVEVTGDSLHEVEPEGGTGLMKFQGYCDTTQSARYLNPLCKCPTYAGNFGPCGTFEAGGNGRCAYCDHEGNCHPQPEQITVEPEGDASTKP